ncbi:MAG: very short patch repair endonuclease [Acidimicrobiales bacterium]
MSGSPEPGRRARPAASSDQARSRMERQGRRDTRPELELRRAVWRLGLRYRVDAPPVRGRHRADLVFRRFCLAVYVDGCFWHRCPLHGTLPRANREWWAAKLDANVSRDRQTDQALADAGWSVVRVWEHEDPLAGADRVSAALSQGPARLELPPRRSRPRI